MINTVSFTTSHFLSSHPLTNEKNHKIRAQYYIALEHLVGRCVTETVSEYACMRLRQYHAALRLDGIQCVAFTNHAQNKAIRSTPCGWWKNKKLRYWLLCDVAFVLVGVTDISKAYKAFEEYLRPKQYAMLGELWESIVGNAPLSGKLSFAEDSVESVRRNLQFTTLPERRFMVYATVSAGKSTLINAIVGKRVVRTSQEVCTIALCSLYNKPFEDGAVHLYDMDLNLDAAGDLDQPCKSKNGHTVAAYFRTVVPTNSRVCLIDTPGANNAIDVKHGRVTKKALREGQFDKLIYIFRADNLGTDEVIENLKYVLKKVPKKKIVFVLNKLDEFRGEDSIDGSVAEIKKELADLGCSTPVVCPFSAYFALLIKTKRAEKKLTDDEQDDYDRLVKKFRRPQYDLSRFYDGVVDISKLDELTEMSVRCGLYGFEKILFS